MQLTVGPRHRQIIRDAVDQFLDGVIECGPADVNLPHELTLEISRFDDHLEIEWSENPEIDLPGPIDPDMLRAEIYEDHAILEMAISELRINF